LSTATISPCTSRSPVRTEAPSTELRRPIAGDYFGVHSLSRRRRQVRRGLGPRRYGRGDAADRAGPGTVDGLGWRSCYCEQLTSMRGHSDPAAGSGYVELSVVIPFIRGQKTLWPARGTGPLFAGTTKGHRRCARRRRHEALVSAGSRWPRRSEAERMEPMSGRLRWRWRQIRPCGAA
jgi:hypothetical protein